MVHVISLALLGSFELRMDGRPVAEVTYARMRALLSYLAVEPERDHRRDDLADMLWPDSDPVTARGNLRRTLADLRRVLEAPTGANLFVATRETIRLSQVFPIDVREFLSAATPGAESTLPDETAVALYRGEFLDGLSLPECPQFEEWARMQREALHCHALALIEKLWRRYARTGDPRALRYVLRHAELEPWDEDVHRQAMLLYAKSGQKSAALEQFEICRRILKAELGTSPGQETAELAESIRNESMSGDDAAASPVPRAHAERRPVTVLYCELIPSNDDDADEAMMQLAPSRERCLATIRRYAGYVGSTRGDGIIAYFGYPRAGERAARQAVEAALAMIREATAQVRIRVGVHSGLVISGGEQDLPDAVGRTSKLAARVRHSVEGNQVSVTRQTRDVVSGYFEFTSLGEQRISGFAEPVEIFRVERETGARTRLDTMERLTPLAGRIRELDVLTSAWRRAIAGSRELVMLRGEPGMGKTRLVRALIEHVQGGAGLVRELRCFPEAVQSPFQPLIAMMESVLDFRHDDAPPERFAKLAAYLDGRGRDSAAAKVPLLAQLLALPLGGRYRPPRSSPQRQKELTVSALVDLLTPVAETQPMLVVVEDLHWIDPSTLEVLTRLAGTRGAAPVFTLLTARPEFVMPWASAPGDTLELAPLSERDSAAMVASIVVGAPDATVRQIVDRSDGVPLFIEEMTKFAAAGVRAAIPPTLHDLLAARIDMLGPAKQAAQLAATLGRVFDLDLLARAYPRGQLSLPDALRTLLEAGLTVQIDAGSHQFRHALIQEAAYHSQTRGDMMAVHRRVAEALQEHFPELVATRPELLAQHLTACGETRLAVDYWLKAGMRAAGYSAHAEAIEHFNRGLQALATLPASAERDGIEFILLINLCPALYAAVGYGSDQATEANARLSALSDRMGNRSELFEAKWALVMNTIANAGSRGVPPRAAQLVPLAGDDPLRRQAAHYAVADAAFWLGDFGVARDNTERALALYQPEQHAGLLAKFGEDLSISCGAYLAWSQYFLGDADEARETSRAMLARARELDHPHTLALALCFASVLHRWMGDVDGALTIGAETREVSKRYGFSVWLAAGDMAHGWALARQGRSEGIDALKAGIAGMKMAIGGISVVFISALAEGYYHLGMTGDAMTTIDDAFQEVERTGDGHYTAVLHRLRGLCLARGGDTGKARAAFEQALALARQQKAGALVRVAQADLDGLPAI